MLCPLSPADNQKEPDTVGLLSYEQAVALYKTDTERVKHGTDAAVAHGLIANPAGNGWWWLSTSDEQSTECVFRVYSNGRIGFDTDFDNENVGVVPVVLISID